ncbi:hypothetical protein [Paenibacillus sp. R14(2021)]|uniref:hypothetical protein n=1 Tax=Paenibacillus sp. R14(2021) TaxID=2859228 RepID=UPI001C613928|nr:hypothetical protein [Paenibacillus sp. R14(2021)]
MQIREMLVEMEERLDNINDHTESVNAVVDAQRAFYTIFGKVTSTVSKKQFMLLLQLVDATNWLRVCEAHAGYKIGFLDAVDLYRK